jgi:hypothetical protein
VYCLDRSSHLSDASSAIECLLAFSAPLSFAEESTGCRADAPLTLQDLLNTALTTISANHLLFPTLMQTNVRSGNPMIPMPISF